MLQMGQPLNLCISSHFDMWYNIVKFFEYLTNVMIKSSRLFCHFCRSEMAFKKATQGDVIKE